MFNVSNNMWIMQKISLRNFQDIDQIWSTSDEEATKFGSVLQATGHIIYILIDIHLFTFFTI